MGLIDAQELVIDRVTSVFRNDFDIYEHHEVVGHITTEGGLASRLLAGNREFTVTEFDGTPVLRLVDVVNFGRDTYELTDAGGQPLGTIRRELSFLTKRITFTPADGGVPLEVRGSFWDYDYAIEVNREPMASISQRWGGLANALLGGKRYAVSFTHTSDARLRQVILGVVVAIDLMKAKDSRSGSSSGGSGG